ncbi:MAG: MBL fold metallo-hydrolase [Candidatus Limiplasma sp.]|nr:MBL fold metallo-hydrolase [Candidatus Limiplasma sp.]
MRSQKISTRGTLFTAPCGGWDNHLYLIQGKKHNFVIDTGLGAGSVEPVKERIHSGGKETIVVNTHYHWDHVWGNGSFQGCIIISHPLCREMISSEWERMMGKNGQYRHGEAVMRLPTLVFQQELSFPEERIKIFHTPGHTPDSISVLDEEDGVLVLADNIGDTLEELVPSLACDRQVYRQTLEQYRQMNFEVCISGHNRPLGKEVIQKILDIL